MKQQQSSCSDCEKLFEVLCLDVCQIIVRFGWMQFSVRFSGVLYLFMCGSVRNVLLSVRSVWDVCLDLLRSLLVVQNLAGCFYPQ